jgi:hypothetical protein
VTLSRRAKKLEKIILDNSPTILTGVAVAGTITTAVLTGRASFKAIRILDEECDIRQEPIPYKDCVKLVWPVYIPPVVLGLGTVTCIVLSNRIGNRRAAALAAAYAISEKTMTEYKEKVIDKIGEHKERQIRDEVAQDQVKRTNGAQTILVSGNSDVLCFDAFSGRYFCSTVETIRKAENDLNHRVLHDNYASLTDWYNLLDLDRTEFSDEVGWNVDKLLEVSLSATLTADDKPCLSINFNVAPVRDYYRFA